MVLDFSEKQKVELWINELKNQLSSLKETMSKRYSGMNFAEYWSAVDICIKSAAYDKQQCLKLLGEHINPKVLREELSLLSKTLLRAKAFAKDLKLQKMVSYRLQYLAALWHKLSEYEQSLSEAKLNNLEGIHEELKKYDLTRNKMIKGIETLVNLDIHNNSQNVEQRFTEAAVFALTASR